jgi:hypothetical protein
MTTETTTERTTIVCLDCPGIAPNEVALVMALDRATAETYVSRHLTETRHRVVTVPGQPRRADAVAMAKVHVEASRIGRPGDDQCTSARGPYDPERCSLKAGHLGGCE